MSKHEERVKQRLDTTVMYLREKVKNQHQKNVKKWRKSRNAKDVCWKNELVKKKQ